MESPGAREQFEREAATWVALEKHPNIVRCFCMNAVDNIPFLFLEWVAGAAGARTDLRDWLDRRGPLEPRRALEFTLDVCRALAHAQNKIPGFVHCDIKPANVLVVQGQPAKLTDFGVVKLVREAGLVPPDAAAPAAGGRGQVPGLIGTRRCMAPEQWCGEPVDARTDLHAVGCLLYELLSGRDPFWTPRPDGLRQGHLESPPPPLGVLVSGVPAEGLDRLVAQCLAKEKGDRYTSPSELLDAISRLYEAWHREPPRAVPEAEGFTASDYNSRGNTYAALGRHAEALADFEAAIRIAPNLAQAHLNKGVLHTKREEWDDALQAFETAAHLGNATGAQYAARVRQVRGPRHRT